MSHRGTSQRAPSVEAEDSNPLTSPLFLGWPQVMQSYAGTWVMAA